MEGFYLDALRDALRHRFPAGEDLEPMRALLGVLCSQREPLGRRELAAILSVVEPRAVSEPQEQRLLARNQLLARLPRSTAVETALSQPPMHVSLCTDPLQPPVACP
jgi:hypothetical protein